MGDWPPSLWHRFQKYTLSGERLDFVRWLPPGSRLPFTQRVHLMGPRVMLHVHAHAHVHAHVHVATTAEAAPVVGAPDACRCSRIAAYRTKVVVDATMPEHVFMRVSMRTSPFMLQQFVSSRLARAWKTEVRPTLGASGWDL